MNFTYQVLLLLLLFSFVIMKYFFDNPIFDFVSQFNCTTNFLDMNVFQKCYVLPVIPKGEKCVSGSAEVKLLYAFQDLKVLVSFL